MNEVAAPETKDGMVSRCRGRKCNRIVTPAQQKERETMISKQADDYLDWDQYKFCSKECARSFSDWAMDMYYH